MTLDTRVLLTQPHAVHDVRAWINTHLLGAPDAREIDAAYWRDAYPDRITGGNAGNQGLAAWLIIHHNPDGPYTAIEYTGDDADGNEVYRVVAEGSMMLSFDTAYGYRQGDARCGDLHAYFIAALAEQFGPVVWQNEYTGEWHRFDAEWNGLHDLHQLGSPRVGRDAVHQTV